MSSRTYTEPAAMLTESEYATSVPRLEHEANWAWNSSLEISREAERATPELVKITRRVLQLHAVEGWQHRKLPDLVRTRAFVNKRPGSRPGKDKRAELESMTPAVFVRSLFEKGVAYTDCPDDLVYGALLAFAQTHYGPSDMRAARTLNEAVIRCLAVRAGIDPLTEELTNGG
jgi:hypothetical protein